MNKLCAKDSKVSITWQLCAQKFLSDPGLIKVYPCPKLIICRLERYLCFLTLGEVAWLQDRLHGMSYFTWGDFLWLFKRVCYPCQEVTRLLQERLLDSQTQVLTHLAKYRDQRGQKVNRQMGKNAKRQKEKNIGHCICLIFVFAYLYFCICLIPWHSTVKVSSAS